MRRAPWLCLLVAAACLDPTQATLELSTNAPCGGDGPEPGTLYESGVLAGSADQVRTGALSGTTISCGADGTIGTIVLYPRAGASEASAVAVGALGNRTAEECLELAQGRRDGDLTDCIIARRRVTFIDGKDLRLAILLDNACAGVVCPEDSTCQRATDAQGNVITECVSARVDCTADGTCEQPTTSATTTGSGGADATTTSGQGGLGGAGGMGTTTTTGTGGGNTAGVITATPLATSVSLLREVSGDAIGPLVAGGAGGVFRPAVMTPVLTYTQPMGVFPIELDGTKNPIRVVLSDGTAIAGQNQFVPITQGDQIKDICPLNQSTSLAVVDAQQIPTLHKLSVVPMTGALQLDLVATDLSANPGNVRAVYGTDSAFAVGTRACFWPGGNSDVLSCDVPASGPLIDVWAEGSIAFAVSQTAVVQLTSGLAQTPQAVPLDPALTNVRLSAVTGSFIAKAIWAGGRAGPDSTAYLVRQNTATTNWDEFTSATLPAIDDVFVAGDGTVYFIAGAGLYKFIPPPPP